MLHLAPPCSTFSRARDRSWKTRLRSKDRPQELPGYGPWCNSANRVARHSLELAEFAHEKLKASVSMENPHASYIWSYLAPAEQLSYRDVVYSPCTLGGSFRKPTRLRCWGCRCGLAVLLDWKFRLNREIPFAPKYRPGGKPIRKVGTPIDYKLPAISLVTSSRAVACVRIPILP